MKLHALAKTVTKSAKRLGRGYGSTRGGHTSSRGQKGQKSRGRVRLTFTGSSWVWFKRLPFIRGKSRFGALGTRYTISLSDLDRLASGSVVTLASLRQAGIINKSHGDRSSVRLVNTGSLTKKLTVRIPATAAAVKAITKAGGSYSVEAR